MDITKSIIRLMTQSLHDISRATSLCRPQVWPPDHSSFLTYIPHGVTEVGLVGEAPGPGGVLLTAEKAILLFYISCKNHCMHLGV